MKTLNQIYASLLVERLSTSDLKHVENYADKIFDSLNIDVNFTKHFYDRLNDARNGKDITEDELIDLFQRIFHQYGQKLTTFPDGFEAVVNDMKTDINIPFEISFETKKDKTMNNLTIMRKKGFKSPNVNLKLKY